MKSRSPRPRTLAVAVAALVAASGLSADRSFAGSPVYVDDSGKAGPNTVVGPSSPQGAPARYIVRFVEQPMALYNSVASSKPVSGIGAIPSKPARNGRLRLDVKSSQAIAYVQYLKDQQHQHLSAINGALGTTITPRYSMQHALNGVVVELTPQQAEKVKQVPGVLAVNRDVPHPLATDIGPGFIGAASIWWGAPAGQDTIFASAFESTAGFLGDGIVIGDIDTGYNSMSPSFQPTDARGYTVQNPLGAGNFLGQCSLGGGAGGISLAGCNDKVIGAYDEINLTGGGPPYSAEDTQGHGSHTASTAAGDFRSADFSGYVTNISGVAPHANLIVYYACSPDPNVQCSTAATSASVDQAIQDGVVDALNYSISGGGDPWNDPTSQAFLSATDAGIFVAAAAGNTSASVPVPLPGTANHAEPWVATVAASTHTGGAIGPNLSITGPGTPPANVQNVPLTEGAGDVPPTSTITSSIVLSPGFGTASDGCAAFSAGQFTSAIALIKRGGCTFITKVNNAVAAGATTVVLSNNTAGVIVPSVPGATVPVYSVTQAQGTDFQTFLAANSNTGSAVIPYPPTRQATQPDVLANFSLLGPVGIDVMKPDVQAPGVNILAAIANDGSPGGSDLVALYNGTSMATPHTTGSAGLMFGVHPEWSPAEAKSALMMTAKEAGLTKPNGVTPSDYFDRGSGRLQDFVATKAGLVLNETGLNFALADPAFGGDPSTLNIASMYSHACVSLGSATCTFERKFHSTQDHTVNWTATVTGDAALSVTVTPSSFSVVAHGTRLVDFDVDATGTNSDGAPHFAEVVLTPDDPTLPPLHLPVSIVVPPPTIAASPAPLNIAITTGTTASGTLTVSNNGGPTLNVTNTNDTTTASTKFVVIDQPSQGNNGYYSTFFTDAGPTGSYASDDFVVPVSGANLSRIFVPGFSTGAALTSLTGHGVHFRVYGNASGLPNGDPEGITSPTPAVYSFDTTIGSAGLSVVGNNLNLDLVAAGAPATNLAAGTYWLVAYVDMAFGTDGGFAQFVTTAGQGNTGAEFGPVFGETAWAAIPDAPGFAMHIEEQVPCGAPWLSTTPATLSIGALDSAPLTVNVDSDFFPGVDTSATAFLCLDSNDPATPVLAVPVSATGAPPVTTVTVNEGFDDITTLPGNGWILQNQSSPLGSTSWFQGNDTGAGGPFDSQTGAPNSYIGANYNNVASSGTISNWLLTPPLTFNRGTSMSFYTRTTNGTYPDRLEVRLCPSGPCTNLGATATDVGDFTVLLKSINPNLMTGDDPSGVNAYPNSWAQFTVATADGVPRSGTGRIALRYFVTNAGLNGSNSDYIGIDTVAMTAGSVNSAPASVASMNGITSANTPANNSRTH